MTSDVDKVTGLLTRAREGDEHAVDELMPLIYEELRRLAGRFLGDRGPSHTLQPTALVHEAYLRLVGGASAMEFSDRLHFFRVAARAMRGVLVNYAQAKGSLKRGGNIARLTLADVDAGHEEDVLDLLALDEALRDLADEREELAQIVELRFFSGFTMSEMAELFALSVPTIERRWRVARAFLRRAMRDEEARE